MPLLPNRSGNIRDFGAIAVFRENDRDFEEKPTDATSESLGRQGRPRMPGLQEFQLQVNKVNILRK